MTDPIRSETCGLSRRADKATHSWRFDGDDPYVICVFCNEIRDAITGRVLRSASAPGVES